MPTHGLDRRAACRLGRTDFGLLGERGIGAGIGGGSGDDITWAELTALHSGTTS